jgi:hypothetical protein
VARKSVQEDDEEFHEYEYETVPSRKTETASARSPAARTRSGTAQSPPPTSRS